MTSLANYQASLPGLCPLADAVSEMAEADNEGRGAVFTRGEVVDFLLDLVGYSTEKKLFELRLLEPSFGRGDFLLRVVDRLIKSWKRHCSTDDTELLANSIRAVELHSDSFEHTRSSLVAKVLYAGVAGNAVEGIVDSWLIRGDFLLAMIPGQFDFVVGNPPYLRIEKIATPLIQEYRRRYKTIYDRADLYIPFMERGLHQLAPNGKLGFICADRWMKNRYGAPLRRLIADQFHLKYNVDMTGTDAFHSDVSAYPAVTVISNEAASVTKAVSKEHVSISSLSSLARRLLDQNYSPPCKSVKGIANGDSPWLLSDCDRLALVRRIESEFPTIEKTGCRVGIGVATGADKVFIGRYDDLTVEEDRKLPLATTKDLVNGEIKWSGLGIVNPFSNDGKLVDLNRFPRLAAYFESHREQLSKRHVAKKVPANWYRTIDRIHSELTTTPKLLIPDIKGHASIVLERGELYPHHNLYYVTSTTWDLNALLAVLRSGIASLFVSLYSTPMRGGYFRFQAQHLRRICIPAWETIPKETQVALRDAGKRNDFAVARELTATIFRMSCEERSVLLSVQPEDR